MAVAVVAVVAVVATTLDAASPAPAPARAEDTASQRAGRVTLGGVDVRLRERTGQVVTVDRTRGHHARVSYWTLEDGRWRKRFSVRDGRIGYGGVVPRRQRRQGSGDTPLGTFGLRWAFGMHRPDPDWSVRYRKVRRGDYWVLDNSSPHYNRYRNRRQGGFRWRLPSGHPDASERLLDYRRQYEWAIVMDFNRQQVRRRGGAIFLHVNGRGATAGCVSVPRRTMKRLMGVLDPARQPVIAVGR
ncbi:L,D-transpeptidase family protein [Nocardioides sp. TF02-7]|uniref:L,D-transpeptidase family protein n=1 Tax=Nocardioides sp. TF02-7 TaxID=2917724 RepID=UPI001F05286F|nr:L,D-transpeptidase family protein [Nocardioides sp. TF02-7]UMG91790.1 L,D-transpeptidase family protein [Nocardioides sp. TF02-7]